MGSWANSLFVRADDSGDVIRAIESLLTQQGYRPSTVAEKSQIGPGAMARQDEEFFAQYAAEEGPSGSVPVSGRKPGQAGHSEDQRFGQADDQFDDDFDEDLSADDYGIDDDIDSDCDDEGAFRVYGDFASGVRQGRKVCVFEPRAGWVGVLDNSLEGNVELARELSGRLSTDTMLVLVNDSDSWNYLLYRDGHEFDEFDAANGDLDQDGDEPTGEWLEAMENEDEEKLNELLMSKAPQHVKFPDPNMGIPFQIAMLGAKIASKQATFWERIKYRWLSIKFLFKLLTGGFSADKMDFGYDVPHTPMDDDALARHIERIKAFFPKANESKLRDLVPQCRFPAEDLLRKFLALVGLPWFFAYLSYDYLSEHSEQELASHDIVQTAELQFDRPGTAA